LKPSPDIRSFGKDKPKIREERSGGVATGKQDVEKLAADAHTIGCLAYEFIDEDVAFGIGLARFLLR
jgi:hypothetical protein